MNRLEFIKDTRISDGTMKGTLLNNSIDNFCAVVEAKKDIENYRDTLTETVDIAKKIVSKINEKAKRIKEGEDILKGICLN